MPLFAKFLVFMNVLAAGLFVYLAALNWNVRQPWAYEVFLSELALDGLPLDEADPGPRRIDVPLHPDVDDEATLRDVFKHTGDKSAKTTRTQKEEVERRKKEVADEVAKAADKRAAIKAFLLPLASSLDERHYWAQRFDEQIPDPDNPEKMKPRFTDQQMEADLMEFFDRANAEKVEAEKHDWLATKQQKKSTTEQTPVTRRQRIAHLLYNLSADTKQHQRVLVVIGLRAYVTEAETQAARLREMSQRIRLATIDERAYFEVEYERLVQRILALSEEVFQRQQVLDEKEKLRDRQSELVKVRQEDVKVLEKDLAQAVQGVQAARESQAELEKQLFDAQKTLGDLKEKTEALTRMVKSLERR